MSQYNRRTIVRGAAWSIPVVAVATQAPAFAASTDVPAPGALVAICRTTGQGNGNCQGYRFRLNFLVDPPYSWNVSITTAQITPSNGPALEIKTPTSFPQVISSTSTFLDLWFCASSSPSQLNLSVSYTTWRTDQPQSTAVTRTFLEQAFTGISGC
ncbi:hypothetical protein GCM10023339_34110 [Alloalcanivorax gelatiniphagus]